MTQEHIVTRWSGWGMLVMECGQQSVSPVVHTGTLNNQEFKEPRALARAKRRLKRRAS